MYNDVRVRSLEKRLHGNEVAYVGWLKLAGGIRRKSERYLGCPIRLLLTFIVLIKSSLLCAWLVREYFFFDFRCSLLSTSGADEEMLRRRSVEVLRIPVFPSDSAPPVNYFDEEYHERMKRFDITLVPRTVSTTFIQPFLFD
ncbi:unnamed protein product [Heligmosomoides polygyrus]|uniref:Uncharacterized protein n=1 Tax=Heligmosomoides polygyrus TaxID=6339 RepID=A0A183FRM9_HELPZ|nr:unnamed protein product [Heligmosomoides polygyrus]